MTQILRKYIIIPYIPTQDFNTLIVSQDDKPKENVARILVESYRNDVEKSGYQ